MSLINKEALISRFNDLCVGECCCCRYSTTTKSGCKVIDDAPEVEPTKHGYWYVSDHDGYFQCSECDSYAHETELGNYCSSCGAKMDEVTG